MQSDSASLGYTSIIYAVDAGVAEAAQTRPVVDNLIGRFVLQRHGRFLLRRYSRFVLRSHSGSGRFLLDDAVVFCSAQSVGYGVTRGRSGVPAYSSMI